MHPTERHPDDLPPPDGDLPAASRRVPRGVAWAGALAVVVLAVALVSLRDAEPEGGQPLIPAPVTSDAVGSPAPSSTFDRFDGATGSLADYRGTPVVVNFWASSCVPCLTEMPAFDEVHRDLGPAVAFIGLNVADGSDRARRTADRTGVTYDLAFDPRGELALELGSTVLPTTAIIGSDGTVAAVHVGAMDAADLRAALAGVR